MTKNMGNFDRWLRVILAISVGVLYFANLISGTAALILGILALILLATAIVGFCPLYLPFKLSSRS
jgi:hypothetical protein